VMRQKKQSRVKATTQHHFINMQLVGKLERFETLIFDVFFSILRL